VWAETSAIEMAVQRADAMAFVSAAMSAVARDVPLDTLLAVDSAAHLAAPKGAWMVETWVADWAGEMVVTWVRGMDVMWVVLWAVWRAAMSVFWTAGR
jgi:hypothetical protein